MARSYNLPPAWNEIGKHEMLPETTHDERARYNFIANLNKHLSAVVSPGNAVAYEKRVEPKFKREHGRDFAQREEVRDAMRQDPHYQSWSALRRSAMEMRQQAGRSIVIRQAQDLADKAAKLSAQQPDTLQLNPNLDIPPYLKAVDNHLMPGSYYTELIPGDVTPAANYDTGLFVTTAGMLGRKNDGGGAAIANWMKETHPNFVPKRILDIGCGLGHNVLPIAQTYPDAEIIAIDAGAPMLRYGHARAVDMGISNVIFKQEDAADLSAYPDGYFDWVQTTMFLHETSGSSIHQIMREIHRVLKPGGITLHIEQPQYTDDMSLYEQFIRDWDAYYNAEPFWSKMHDIEPEDLMAAAGFNRKTFMQIGVKAVNDLDDPTKAKVKEAEDHGRAPVWNVFGAWKR